LNFTNLGPLCSFSLTVNLAARWMSNSISCAVLPSRQKRALPWT
jgi:hypothetical protein